MRKKFAALLAIVILTALLLSACSASGAVDKEAYQYYRQALQTLDEADSYLLTIRSETEITENNETKQFEIEYIIKAVKQPDGNKILEVNGKDYLDGELTDEINQIFADNICYQDEGHTKIQYEIPAEQIAQLSRMGISDIDASALAKLERRQAAGGTELVFTIAKGKMAETLFNTDSDETRVRDLDFSLTTDAEDRIVAAQASYAYEYGDTKTASQYQVAIENYGSTVIELPDLDGYEQIPR